MVSLNVVIGTVKVSVDWPIGFVSGRSSVVGNSKVEGFTCLSDV